MLARHLTKVSTINRFYYCFFIITLFITSFCFRLLALPVSSYPDNHESDLIQHSQHVLG